jgi:hypothetical protein
MPNYGKLNCQSHDGLNSPNLHFCDAVTAKKKSELMFSLKHHRFPGILANRARAVLGIPHLDCRRHCV